MVQLFLKIASLSILFLSPPFKGLALPEEKLIGWRGETYDPDASWDPLNITASKHDSIPLPASRSWIEVIR
jgi:hypothetical protein